MRLQKFEIPCDIDGFTDSKKKVAIVSIFGKSQFHAKGCKIDMLNSIIPVDLLDEKFVDEKTLCDIEGYYNAKDRVIYLQLRGFLDTSVLVTEFDKFLENSERKDFLSAWAHMRTKYAHALLMLFHISHILILTHPTHIFDYSYIHLFRALDSVRLKVSSELSSTLSSIPGLSKSWISSARPCSPRVLFYFESCPSVFRNSESGANIKKLEHSLEDQIYQVLRKNRIVTNICSNSLFAIPVNQEFVYVNTEKIDGRDYLGYMTRKLIQSCKITKTTTASKELNPSKQEFVPNSHSFNNFLRQHVNLSLGKGFDDNVGRHSTPMHFDVPSLNLFAEVINKLHDFFLKKNKNSLHSLLDIDVKFSRSRCNKVLPRAVQTYKDNLPQHYTRAYHKTKLGHAMAVFEMHARGPLFEEFSGKIQDECEKYWRAGRQMCEVLSLTGNPCTHPIHKGGSEGAGGGELAESREDKEDFQIMEHSSGVRYICACNCGRHQGPREDPFSARQANYEFFQSLGKQCGCSVFESIEFPVFKPSTHNFRAAQLISDTKRKDSIARTETSTSQGPTQNCSGANSHEEMTDYGSGGQSPTTNESINEERLNRNKTSLTPGDGHKVVIEVSEEDSESLKEKPLLRQPSTTEYLPGMLHTESPAGLLPQFSSWSLICLGPSSLYSHNLGLQHQAGVLSHSAFLLPWDVTIKTSEDQKDKGSLWPAVSDGNQHVYGQRGKTFSNARKTKGGKEFVVKIFVGVEYECPRGHRFMASAPDKVLKASGSGIVKDSGNKVTSNTADMPLYFACPCRQSNPLIAQLMRIHVVTPKAPVHVTLNPRVQPGPAPCPIFITGCDEPIKLSQSAYWILRLPYVYIGEKGPYLPPKEQVSISHGRLLAGMYGISEIVSDKKTASKLQ